MNICMFTNTYLPHVGGVARSVSLFAEDLRRLGHLVLIVAPTFENRDGAPEAEEDFVVRVAAIQNFNGSDFSVSVPIPFQLDRDLERFQPDIVHSHHPFLLGDAALRAARQRNLPLVFTHHTLYENYTHYVPLDSGALRRFVINLSTEYANLCSRVVAPSESVARILRGRGVLRPIDVIPTGVDIEFMETGDGRRFREEQGLPETAEVIGHVGRLAPEKNLEYLAESVALYLEENSNACFLVVGSGPSEAVIREIFRKKELSHRLLMAGEKTGTALCDAYHAMDLFVFASKSETQGMVLVEAMAAGKPVVALDASGAREVVEDGVNGRLLPESAGRETFTEAIGGFFQGAGKDGAWRRGALRTARSLSRLNCARKLAGVYESVLEEGAGTEKQAGEANETDVWEKLHRMLEAEWDLVAGKAAASLRSVRERMEGVGEKEESV